MKYSSIASVMSNSEITPSLSGRRATTLGGVRPTISLASEPMASGRLDFFSIATHEGSLMTMPLPRTRTKVLAVPRSIPMSSENRPRSQFSGLKANGEVLLGLGGRRKAGTSPSSRQDHRRL
jgi:hypothetical protein